MENAYSWLFILSGSTITALGTFLIASGRELRSKRREFERFKRNQTAMPVNSSVIGQCSEAHLPVELIATNEELTKEISFLTSRLEESQRMLSDLQKDQAGVLAVQSENRQLQAEIARLSNQLETSERQHGESLRRIQETAEAGTALQTEIAKLQRVLAERDTTIESLHAAAQNAAAMEIENQRLQEQKAYSERRAIVERHAQLQTRFAELMRETEELTAKNTQLLKEADALARTLAASEEIADELRANERSARLNNQQLIEMNEQLQREIADLKQQLASVQSQFGASAMSKSEAAKWNHKLQSEISELRQELEQRQATANELQKAERRCTDFQSESEQLRLSNQGLQKELDDLGVRWNASETRSVELARRNQEFADHYERLEIELADYKEQLEASQSKHREINSAQERLANAESREMLYRAQQQKLETQIADLERELAEEKDKVLELDSMQKRLEETERICQELGEENRRLEDERAQWQELLAENEDSQRQLSLLRKQLEALRTERARVIEGTYQPTERLVAAESASGAPSCLTSDPDRAEAIQGVTGVSLPPSGSNEIDGNSTDSVSRPMVTENIVMEGEKTSRRVRALATRNWRFRALPAAIVVAIVVAVGFFESPFSTSHESPFAPERNSDEFSADDVPKPLTKAVLRLPGTYETVRATQVYTEPSEDAALIGNIGPKTKLNVVGSRNGWLEIRSKHGRPPGFIRQEAAVKIGQN